MIQPVDLITKQVKLIVKRKLTTDIYFGVLYFRGNDEYEVSMSVRGQSLIKVNFAEKDILDIYPSVGFNPPSIIIEELKYQEQDYPRIIQIDYNNIQIDGIVINLNKVRKVISKTEKNGYVVNDKISHIHSILDIVEFHKNWTNKRINIIVEQILIPVLEELGSKYGFDWKTITYSKS